MDGSTFDTLTRSFSIVGSRRRALAGLLLGSPVLLGSRTEETEAHDPSKKCKKKSGKQKKKCLKKAKKHNAQHANQPPAPLVVVFDSPGTVKFTVPVAGTLRIDAFGAGGGPGGPGGDGVDGMLLLPGGAGGDPGVGGHVMASVVVAAGEEFQIMVGLVGQAGTRGGNSDEGGQGGAGGQSGFPFIEEPGDFGNPGGANSGGGGGGGGGGGRSDVRRPPFDITAPLVAANGGSGGGGGGGGGATAGTGGHGGIGGPIAIGGTPNGGAGEAGDAGASGVDGGPGGGVTVAIGPPGAVLVPDQQAGNGKVILTLTPA